MSNSKGFKEREDEESGETRYCLWGNKYKTGPKHGIAAGEEEIGTSVQSPICQRDLDIS